MMDVSQAKRLIFKNLPRPTVITVSLAQALGHVLAEEISTPFDLPLANNAAMDGFAFCSADVLQASAHFPVTLRVGGTIRAGAKSRVHLKKGTCCRIMTGAFLPRGADTVVAQEHAECQGENLVFREPIKKGQHVRYRGEEVRKGTRVLLPRTEITPGIVGILATLGQSSVKVFRKPQVALLATGQELVAPGTRLQYGQIFDSNSWMVESALRQAGFSVSLKKTIGDHPSEIKRAVAQALKKADVLILTGGVSVGAYDFVKSVLAAAGVQKILWKVNQKPGKPLFVGKRKKQLVFALPGNPAAVFVCFYEYVLSALRTIMGLQNPDLEQRMLPLARGVNCDREKVLFLKAKVDGAAGQVTSLAHQASHMLSSLRDTTGLIVLPPSEKPMGDRDLVRVDLLPCGGFNT